MMEKIKKLNLELALFVKNLHSYTENVNEIDDETTKLLVETILAVNKLQSISKHRESSFTNENRFVCDLNEDIFKCGRHIVCCLCHEQFPLNSEDFDIHVRKENHKEKESKLRFSNQSVNGSDILLRPNSTICIFNSDRNTEMRPSTSVSSLNSNDPRYRIMESNVETNATSVVSVKENEFNGISIIQNIPERNRVNCSTEQYLCKPPAQQSAKNVNDFDVNISNQIPVKSTIVKRINRDSSDSSENLLDKLKTAIRYSETKVTTPQPSTSKSYDIDYISKSAIVEMANIFSRSQKRIRDENEIIETLERYFRMFDSRIKVVPFGSVIYGFGGSTTDFNILIETELSKIPCDRIHRFFELTLNMKRVQQDFEILSKVKENRILKQQFQLLHKKTHIVCVLQFDNTSSTVKNACELIRNYMALSPICKNLIVYVKALLNVSNEIAMQNEFNSYIISVLEKRLQKTQQHLSSEQQRLRDGIASNPTNWTNSAMWVQDIVLADVNITAEISTDLAKNFVKLCEMFVSHVPPFDDFTKVNQTIMLNQNQLDRDVQLYKLIDEEIANMCHFSHLEWRRRYEVDISLTIKKYIQQFNASLEVLLFGSSKYGIRRSKQNLNFLINTHGKPPKEFGQQFFSKFEKTDIAQHFKQIHKVSANRILRRQISMVHIQSEIECLLLFDSDATITKSTEIIKEYINIEPMCQFLITYICSWQHVLKTSGAAKFQFNTYIISVLVIFFLQLNYKLPTVSEIQSSKASNYTSNVVSFRMIPSEFFSFYGNNYQMWNHVISAHIGQWQERKMQSEQKQFSEDQHRLRNGIEMAPENWTYCTMYVQDLVRPDVNITAEISKLSAENFQQLCKTFSQKTLGN